MKIPIQWFEEILFGKWMPWRCQAITEVQWGLYLTKIKPRGIAFQERYAVSIDKPVNNMTRFYKALIDAQAVAYLNLIHQKMNRAKSSDQKAYIIFSVLERTIPSFFNKLVETMEIINESVLPDKIYFKNTEYVFACLRANSCRLFLEIQDAYPDLFKYERLNESDLVRQYFFQTKNTDLLLKKLELPVFDTSSKAPLKADSISDFVPIKDDFRPKRKKSLLTYKEIVKDPVQFARFEVVLADNYIINKEYDYLKKQGNQIILAIVYVLAFKKDYFSKYSFRNGKEPMSFTKVKAFLNFRYNANVDKEARNFMLNPELMKPYIEKTVWLSLFFKV
jgi:hypothetical protein